MARDTKWRPRWEPLLYAFDGGFMLFWEMLFAEWAAILLLGGGLLTWVVRRERRRRALPAPGTGS